TREHNAKIHGKESSRSCPCLGTSNRTLETSCNDPRDRLRTIIDHFDAAGKRIEHRRVMRDDERLIEPISTLEHRRQVRRERTTMNRVERTKRLVDESDRPPRTATLSEPRTRCELNAGPHEVLRAAALLTHGDLELVEQKRSALSPALLALL